MNTKGMTIKSMDDAGQGLARIAILSAVDSDGDTYVPGAFAWKEGGGQWVQIIPAHDRRAMPFGKAWIYEQGDEVLAELHLNLATQAGKDWHAALKFDLAKGNAVQEWSYGYQVLDADYQMRAEQRVQVLKRLDVDEISPVLRGAGVGTGTLAMKGLKGAALKADHFGALIGGLGELAAALGVTIEEDGGVTVLSRSEVLSATGRKQLEQIHATLGKALDAGSEPEGSKASEAERLAADSAVAGFLKHQARRHLAK